MPVFSESLFTGLSSSQWAQLLLRFAMWWATVRAQGGVGASVRCRWSETQSFHFDCEILFSEGKEIDLIFLRRAQL